MRTKWEEQHYFYMFLQEKKGSILEVHQTQLLHMRMWRHVSMGGELLGYLLPSSQLGVFQGRAYSEHHQRDPHQVSRFCSGIHPG